MKDYLSLALAQIHSGQWFSWRKKDDNGNVIPNDQRMTYENVIVIKDGITKPTKAEVDAKIAEIKQEEIDKENRKTTAKQKLIDLGLTEEEVKAFIGV